MAALVSGAQGKADGNYPIRLGRLEQLARGLAREVDLQPVAEDVLLFRERRQYLRAVEDAPAGAEAARVVLAGVVKRMGGD